MCAGQGKAANGTQILLLYNVPVVEDPNDSEDAERLLRAFGPWQGCELCGSRGAPVDVYYDLPWRVLPLALVSSLSAKASEGCILCTCGYSGDLSLRG